MRIHHQGCTSTRSFYKGSGEWLKTLVLCDARYGTVMAEVNAEAKSEEWVAGRTELRSRLGPQNKAHLLHMMKCIKT